MDEQDVKYLKGVFDDRYIKKDDCDEKIKERDGRIAVNNTRLSVIESKLGTITWLLTAIGGGIIMLLIENVFSNL